jgi:hypothetical protein
MCLYKLSKYAASGTVQVHVPHLNNVSNSYMLYASTVTNKWFGNIIYFYVNYWRIKCINILFIFVEGRKVNYSFDKSVYIN